jgi:hypothetical protein
MKSDAPLTVSTLKRWFFSMWKTVAVVVSAGTAITSLNVKIHEDMKMQSQAAIADTVKLAVKDALTEMTGRVSVLETRVYFHGNSIARLEARIEK